jgi:hypothetical protein
LNPIAFTLATEHDLRVRFMKQFVRGHSRGDNQQDGEAYARPFPHTGSDIAEVD